MPARVLQITDPHLFADPATRFKRVPTWAAFGELLDFLESERIGFDLAVLTGDLAHDERPETYAAFRAAFADQLQPLRVIPGNHDVPATMREQFPERVAADLRACAFSTDLGGWRVIGLDSHAPGEVSGRIDGEQLDWLEGELLAAGERPVLVFVHHPPFAIGSPWLDRIKLEDPDPLWETLSIAPNVRALATGHVHHEFADRIGSVDVFTTPSTCMQFEPAGDRSGYTDEPPGFRLFDLDRDRCETRVVRLPKTTWVPIDDAPREERWS